MIFIIGGLPRGRFADGYAITHAVGVTNAPAWGDEIAADASVSINKISGVINRVYRVREDAWATAASPSARRHDALV